MADSLAIERLNSDPFQVAGWISMSLESNASFMVNRQFFVVSPKKFAVMTLFTFGWYSLFCFYRSWVLHRAATGERVLPLMRALFGLFFMYSLFRRVDKKICQTGRSYAWSPAVLTVAIVLGWIMLLFVDQGLWQSHPHLASSLLIGAFGLQVFALTRVQCAINFCEGDESGQSNARFTAANWLGMALGLVMWPLLILLTLLSVLLSYNIVGA
ncbi:hypothetical protein [Pseudomonas faucium]|uniref:hypothetical protein n=1 Tax=Pseudomonas faucium TaxID=2740518 RepID=UPI0039C3B0A5